jgi:hypothetical protein
MAAIVFGRVTDENGVPVVGAAVVITGDSPRHRDIAALTDRDGRFRFAGLEHGSYEFLVNAEGHPPKTAAVTIRNQEEVQLEIQLNG